LTLVLVLLAFFSCCCVGTILGGMVILNADKGTNDQPENGDSPGTVISEDPKFDDIKVNVQVESIYNDSIPASTVEKLRVYEIDLGLEALKLLQGTNWDGDKDTPLPLSYSDFDQALLQEAIEDEKDDTQSLTIPDEMLGLFTTTTAQEEIMEVIESSYDEYLQYLAEKGVAQQYIDEIKNNAFPKTADRMHYHANNDPDSPFTSIDKYSGDSDYSKRELNMYDIDIYLHLQMLQDTKILGDTPSDEQDKVEYLKNLRNMGIRFLMYHEMTHVLQRAYITLHVDAEHKTDKSAWIYADKTLMDVDDQYFWLWGGSESLQMSNNRDISQESQADGIAFEMLTTVYDMSSKQKEALWDRYFGRFDTTRDQLNEIKSIAESEYPDFAV